MSRKLTTEDLFNTLLVTSDPVVNSHRSVPEKSPEPLAGDVLTFLEEPAMQLSSSHCEQQESDMDNSD